jgi:hypothetical protein
MVLIINWPSHAGYDPAMRNQLAKLCAGLCEHNLISGCMAALPKIKEERAWLLSFLHSMKRAGVERANVIMSDTCTRQDIEECESAGLKEVIILQSGTHELPVQSKRLACRIWLSGDVPGNYQRHVCAAVRRHPNVLSIEPAPFTWQQPVLHAGAAKHGEDAGYCDWHRSVITISNTGTIVLASPFSAGGMYTPRMDTGCKIPEHIRDMKGKLQVYPICHSCNKAASFVLPEWIHEPDYNGPLNNGQLMQQETVYTDHVKQDAGAFTHKQHQSAMKAFLDRVKEAGLKNYEA